MCYANYLIIEKENRFKITSSILKTNKHVFTLNV